MQEIRLSTKQLSIIKVALSYLISNLDDANEVLETEITDDEVHNLICEI